MIVLKNVSKIYGKSPQVVALHNVTMEVKKEEFLAVMGPSGSGKSTLLYIIGGLLTPTKGEVLINGVSIYKLNSREKCGELKTIGGVMFKCSKNEGRITFTVGNGRLVVEASNAEEALCLLEDILA